MEDLHNSAENTEEISTSREEPVEPFPVDEKGRRIFDENGDKIHWATRSQRVTAWVLAILVILITLAYAYSLSTGDLFFR